VEFEDDVAIWADCDGYLIGPGAILRQFQETGDEFAPYRTLADAGLVKIVDDVADVVWWREAD